MKNGENNWTTLSKENKYDNPWISVEEHQVINPGGGRGIYGKVHFKNIATGVIPIDDDGNTYLVGQFRYVLNEYSWEIPEGGCPLNEEPLVAARRELLEETGLKADSWREIVKIHTSNSVTDEVGYIYLATDLKKGAQKLEESEQDLKVWKLPFEEAYQMVMEGKITDSLSVVGILKAQRIIGER